MGNKKKTQQNLQGHYRAHSENIQTTKRQSKPGTDHERSPVIQLDSNLILDSPSGWARRPFSAAKRIRTKSKLGDKKKLEERINRLEKEKLDVEKAIRTL